MIKNIKNGVINIEIKKDRKSGIELIKILAIFLIIISHVTQTLFHGKYFNNLQFNDGYYNATATTDINVFVLMIFMYLGKLGNLVFIISSSYFLSNKENTNKKKVFKLALNTIIISLIFLAIYLIANVDLSKKEIIKSIFPITFQNNWFITIYLLFIMIVPYLNIVIKHLNQKQLLRLSCTLFILYFVIAFIRNSYCLNNLIVFVTIYFIVNYFKKYMENFLNKNCVILLVLGIISLTILQFSTNFLGLRFEFLQNKQFYWRVNNNPMLFIIAIALFYLFKRMSFKSHFINTISSLSLYIYLIHENLFFRRYTRVYIWHYIYEKIGYTYIIIETILYALLLFIISSIISYVYKITLDKFTDKLIEKIFYSNKIKNIFIKIENKMFMLS